MILLPKKPLPQMINNDTVPTIKPLASKIEKPHLPRFEELRGGHLRYPYVSHLRVNRPLYKKPFSEEVPGAPPMAVRGEKAFEPSLELRQRLDRIRQIEESITQVTPSPLPTKEEREKELKEARFAYQEQLNKLRQREEELRKNLAKSEARMAQVQVELKEKKETEKPREEIENLVQQQQLRIKELEANQASMEEELISTREKWKEKVAHLKKLKGETEEKQPQQLEGLGRQINEYQQKISQFKEKRNELVQRIHKEESELERLNNVVGMLTAQNKEKEELIHQQEQKVETLQRDKEKISRFANDLVKKLAQVENLQRVEHTITVAQKEPSGPEYQPKTIRAIPKAKDSPPLTSKPNAISGVVIDAQGQPLENTLVIIRDQDQKPQRALRTNKVGEFIVSSPLASGTYRIETQKEGFNFDIMEIELAGKVLQPIEIKAVP
jgi:myosin heavy subunit